MGLQATVDKCRRGARKTFVKSGWSGKNSSVVGHETLTGEKGKGSPYGVRLPAKRRPCAATKCGHGGSRRPATGPPETHGRKNAQKAIRVNVAASVRCRRRERVPRIDAGRTPRASSLPVTAGQRLGIL